jgi:hypothetical protein
MGKYIDWYLVELTKKMGGRLSKDQAENLTTEISQHLEDSALSLRERAVTVDEAEQEAIRRFGSPGKIAWRLLEANLGKPSLPKWPVIWAAAGTLWAAGWQVTGWYPGWSFAILKVLPIFGLLFCIASFRGRRARPWAMFGISASATLAVIGVLSLTWMNLYQAGGIGLMPLWFEESDRALIQARVDNLEKEVPMLRSGVDAFRKGDLAAQEAFHVSNGWRVPDFGNDGSNFGIPLSGTRSAGKPVSYSTVGSREEAMGVWRGSGSRALSEAESALETHKRNLLAMSISHRMPVKDRAREYVNQVVPVGMGWACMLMLANFLCTWLGELYRWSRVRLTRFA